MATSMTNSSTPEPASPYAEIERLPRLTAEEEARLLADLHFASRAPAAKQRLIEGYLPRVLTLAKQYDRCYRVITYDDLVQEGSLALMRAIDKCATMPITKSLSAFVGTVVRSALARALATDAAIAMPNSTWYVLRASGRDRDYPRRDALRLDARPADRDETWAEWLAAPALVLPVPDADQEQSEQCRQVLTFLDWLTPRQRQVLTLRYGLDPADARCHCREETARLLGLAPSTVRNTEVAALAALRQAFQAAASAGVPLAPVEQEPAAPPVESRPRRVLSPAQREYNQRRGAERQARLETTFRAMQEQGLHITSETLSAAAHVDHKAACAFVKAHLPQSVERARLRAIPVEQRLAEAFAGMVERGETLSNTRLSAAAHTDVPTARAFLRREGVPPQQGDLPRQARREVSSQASRTVIGGR